MSKRDVPDIAAGRVVDNNTVLTMLDELIGAHEARCQG